MGFAAQLAWWRSSETANISRFAASIKPEWVEEALQATGVATIRRRKLPAEKTLWLVLGMALFGDRSIQRVVEHLKIVYQGLIAPSSISEARGRLTAAPLLWLFNKVADTWAPQHETKWRGLSLYGVDGSSQRVSETRELVERFGRPNGHGASSYPRMRFVALMNLSNRLLAGVTVGSWNDGELALATDLWDRIPDNSITIADKGFVSYRLILYILTMGKNRHFLVRAKNHMKYEVQTALPDGSAIVTIKAQSDVRRWLPDKTTHKLTLRAISYQHAGGAPSVLLTTLLNHEEYPACDVVALYHKRWELEIGFDEIKTHMLQRKEALRSQTVDGVLQEFWGILLVYNLVRREMQLVAAKKGVTSDRISFTGALLQVQMFFLLAQTSAQGNIPKDLAKLDEQLGRSIVLPPRRTERRSPRHVKIQISQYAKKPPRDFSADSCA